MLTSNLHDDRVAPVCHMTGEKLAVDNWGNPVDSWVFFVGDMMMKGHVHEDGTHHEFAAE